jgi:hypothetical protein
MLPVDNAKLRTLPFAGRKLRNNQHLPDSERVLKFQETGFPFW